jgi:hypothetical protein
METLLLEPSFWALLETLEQQSWNHGICDTSAGTASWEYLSDRAIVNDKIGDEFLVSW